MNDINTAFGTLVAPGTLRLQRSLPGPIERVWHYLTDSEARGSWLASGPMDLRVGGDVRLEFHNDDLSDHRVPTPERYRTEDGCHHQSGQVTACEPPHLLAHTWGEADGSASEVRFDLQPDGDRVLLTITHARLPDRAALLSVSAGWHAHVGILLDQLEGRAPGNFWVAHEALETAYAERLPREAAA
ncbi:SRPBCC family protein [Pseudoxanthomonas japonensis]|uniref:SRPBCC family protein n=1 Tax=Pseudoxanthomonas japonensis TaxID=69284 RepID=UPI00374A2434